MHCKVPCNVQPLTAHRPHSSRTMCSTTLHLSTRQMFDPNRRPYATERLLFTQTTQQHNRTLVPARVPIPCPFGQVASMRNQLAPNGTAQLQPQRANARHRPTFPTHELKTQSRSSVVFKVRSSLVRSSRLSKTSPSLFHVQSSPTKQVHNPCADNLLLRNQLTWCRPVGPVDTTSLTVHVVPALVRVPYA